MPTDTPVNAASGGLPPEATAAPLRADVAIVGAGPVGLCLARGLALAGLSVALIEKQPRARLAEAAFDGREIALTQASCAILRELGLWQRFDAADLSPLREARVLNGSGPAHRDGAAMTITARSRHREELGFLVPNHLIRRAAYAALFESPQAGRVTLLDDSWVHALRRDDGSAQLQLGGAAADREVHAPVVVAADSRFSEMRRLLGIGAQMRDFGKTMLVCRVTHESPHHHAAWEWFGYGQTLALLPLNPRPDGGPPHRASVVLTLAGDEMQQVLQLDDVAFGEAIALRFQRRLGAMAVDRTDPQGQGARHTYPLVGVYADRFVGPRCALVGDAAVGMHPVTAHGFNLGLQGQRSLSQALAAARGRGEDIGAPRVLAAYERAHRRAAWPLYRGTNFVASLYTLDAAPARWAREAVLRLADRIAPVKDTIAAHLVQEPRSPGR